MFNSFQLKEITFLIYHFHEPTRPKCWKRWVAVGRHTVAVSADYPTLKCSEPPVPWYQPCAGCVRPTEATEQFHQLAGFHCNRLISAESPPVGLIDGYNLANSIRRKRLTCDLGVDGASVPVLLMNPMPSSSRLGSLVEGDAAAWLLFDLRRPIDFHSSVVKANSTGSERTNAGND
jgi:hypothetical protein